MLLGYIDKSGVLRGVLYRPVTRVSKPRIARRAGNFVLTRVNELEPSKTFVGGWGPVNSS